MSFLSRIIGNRFLLTYAGMPWCCNFLCSNLCTINGITRNVTTVASWTYLNTGSWCNAIKSIAFANAWITRLLASVILGCQTTQHRARWLYTGLLNARLGRLHKITVSLVLADSTEIPTAEYRATNTNNIAILYKQGGNYDPKPLT